jgi:hypothetical protein
VVKPPEGAHGGRGLHADGGRYVRGKRGDDNFMIVFSWVDDLTLMGNKSRIIEFTESL